RASGRDRRGRRTRLRVRGAGLPARVPDDPCARRDQPRPAQARHGLQPAGAAPARARDRALRRLPRPGGTRRRRRGRTVRQRADHQPDLVLPRGPPLPAAGQPAARDVPARPVAAGVVLRGLHRRGALLAGDHRLRSLRQPHPAGADPGHRHRHLGAAGGRARGVPARAHRRDRSGAPAALLPARRRRQRGPVPGAPGAARAGRAAPAQPARARLRTAAGLVRGGVLPQRDDLLRQAHPVPGAAADHPAAGPGGPPVYRALGKLQPRRRPGGAVRAHRVPGRTTGRWTMSTALAAPPAGTYYDTALKTRAIRLLPADYVVTDEPVALVTLLGSCVAACLYDPLPGLGGMNHFMPPGGHGDDGKPARYGVNAMELLINGLLKRGANRRRLQAKVFGGGNVLSGIHSDPIGTRNASFVLDYLDAEKIPVLAQDLGDNQARKIGFFPRTGRTLVKRLPATRDDVVDVERALYGRLARAPVAGPVELF